jgi:hypothetical protein
VPSRFNCLSGGQALCSEAPKLGLAEPQRSTASESRPSGWSRRSPTVGYLRTRVTRLACQAVLRQQLEARYIAISLR